MSSTNTEIQGKLLESKAQYEIQERTIENVVKDYREDFHPLVKASIDALRGDDYQKNVVSTILYYVYTQHPELEIKEGAIGLSEVEKIISQVEFAFLPMCKIETIPMRGHEGKIPQLRGLGKQPFPTIDPKINPAKEELRPQFEKVQNLYKNLMGDLVTTIDLLVKEGSILKLLVKNAVILVNDKLKEENQQKVSWLMQAQNFIIVHRQTCGSLMTTYRFLMDDWTKKFRQGAQWPWSPAARNTLEDSGFPFEPTVVNLDRGICPSCKEEVIAFRTFRDNVAKHSIEKRCNSKAVEARKKQNRKNYEGYEEDVKTLIFSSPLGQYVNKESPLLIICDYFKEASLKVEAESSLRLFESPYVRKYLHS